MEKILSLSILFSAFSVIGFTAIGPPDTASEPVKVVFVKDGQVFYRSALDAPDVQLTGEASIKFLPVWSKDGSHIAFAERTGDTRVGRLVVIDEHGRRLWEVELDSRRRGDTMRYIESLEWVSPTKLAVSGSANPSLAETRLIDLEQEGATENIFDDGPSADFSPDGKHFAYMNGSPHFTPEEFREPALNIDFRRIFPEEGVRVRFLTERAWSSDSKALAVVAENVSSGTLTLVIYRIDAGLERRALTLSAREVKGLFWSSGTVFVKTTNGVVRSLENGQVEVWKDGKNADEAKQAVDIRQALVKRLEGNGRTSPDFWCETCSLSASPRRVTIEP